MIPCEKLCASLQTIDFIENWLGEDSPYLAFLIGCQISTLRTKLNENIWFSETIAWNTYEIILSWATSVWKFNHLTHPDKCFHHFQHSAGRHKNLETLLFLNLASQPSLSFTFLTSPLSSPSLRWTIKYSKRQTTEIGTWQRNPSAICLIKDSNFGEYIGLLCSLTALPGLSLKFS